MRKLSNPGIVANAMKTLKGRAGQADHVVAPCPRYEAKINSGDLILIAEVLRDLYRGDGQPEQSYSERQLFEVAFDRLTREVAAAEKLEQNDAIKQVEGALIKKAA